MGEIPFSFDSKGRSSIYIEVCRRSILKRKVCTAQKRKPNHMWVQATLNKDVELYSECLLVFPAQECVMGLSIHQIFKALDFFLPAQQQGMFPWPLPTCLQVLEFSPYRPKHSTVDLQEWHINQSSKKP